jgi:hypothetical protein
MTDRYKKRADMGKRRVKITNKVLTYFMDGPKGNKTFSMSMIELDV